METEPAPGAPPAGEASPGGVASAPASPRLSGLAIISLLLGIAGYVPFFALAFYSLVQIFRR